MSRSVSLAVLRAGLVSPGVLQEIRRWGLPVDITDEEIAEQVDTAEEALGEIQAALDHHSMVEIRATDLDILHRFMSERRRGKLVVDGKAVDITYCQLPTGEYAIPWISEGVADLFFLGDTHLRLGRRKIYVRDVQEIFFGEVKTFMLCTAGEKGGEDE